MKPCIEPTGIFNTPESMDDLMEWIERLNGGERAMAMTAAMMAWNLACKLVADQYEEST